MTDKKFKIIKARKLDEMLDEFIPGPNFVDDRNITQQVNDIFRAFADVHNIGVLSELTPIGTTKYSFLYSPHEYEYGCVPGERYNKCKCHVVEIFIDFNKWDQSVDMFSTAFKQIERNFHLNPWESCLTKENDEPSLDERIAGAFHVPNEIMSSVDVALKKLGEAVRKNNAYIVPSRHCGMRATLGLIDEMHTLPLSGNKYHYMIPKGWRVPEIKDVKFEAPATIVFWGDGTKTVVRAQGEEYDPEKGLAMAISRKALGNEYGYYNTFKHWLKKWKKKNKKMYKHDESVPEKEKHCVDCQHHAGPYIDDFCKECFNDNKSRFKEKIEEPKKTCENCKHNHGNEAPHDGECLVCVTAEGHEPSHWEPKEDDNRYNKTGKACIGVCDDCCPALINNIEFAGKGCHTCSIFRKKFGDKSCR